MIYISQNLSYKPWKELQIYFPKELESTFILGIYWNAKQGKSLKHPSTKHYKYSKDFLNTPLALENKPIVTGDCNLNFIKYMQNKGVNQFLEKIISNNFIPQIILPTSVTEKTAMLIDNIFLNSYEHNSNWASGNITTYISDHLPHFWSLKISSNLHLNKILQSKTLTKRLLKQNYLNLIGQLLQRTMIYINLCFGTFLCFINKILDKHAPIKTEKRENKTTSKLSRGIKTLMKKRDKLYKHDKSKK